MLSGSYQQRSFYFLLSGVFLLHICFMLLQIRDHIVVSPSQSVEAIKIKLIQDALKEIGDTNKKQIVQSENSTILDKPKEEAFLSDKDRSFDRQTVAKNIDTFKKAALGNAASTQVSKKVESGKKRSLNKNLKLSDLGVVTSAPAPQEINRSPASASRKGLENGELLADGLSSTNDYIEEMTLGDFTHLNTVEYKHYGFFHRIRQKLEQFWGNSIKEKSLALFKSGRRMPASQDLITSLQVTLNAAGEIIGVKILGASGIKELDDAAIESFNQAGPFPNPPKDLLVNGKATIEWGFVVKS